MKKEKSEKEIKKLLMAVLVTQGISAVTLGKILGVTQQNVSLMLPISDIQKDIKRHEQSLRQKASGETGRKTR